MRATSDESISTLNCPDCSLSFSYLPSGAKKSFKLPFTPPFFGSIFSLSSSSSSSSSSPINFFFFFIPQCQGLHTENTQVFLCFHSPEQHGQLFAAFFFCQRE